MNIESTVFLPKETAEEVNTDGEESVPEFYPTTVQLKTSTQFNAWLCFVAVFSHLYTEAG